MKRSAAVLLSGGVAVAWILLAWRQRRVRRVVDAGCQYDQRDCEDGGEMAAAAAVELLGEDQELPGQPETVASHLAPDAHNTLAAAVDSLASQPATTLRASSKESGGGDACLAHEEEGGIAHGDQSGKRPGSKRGEEEVGEVEGGEEEGGEEEDEKGRVEEGAVEGEDRAMEEQDEADLGDKRDERDLQSDRVIGKEESGEEKDRESERVMAKEAEEEKEEESSKEEEEEERERDGEQDGCDEDTFQEMGSRELSAGSSEESCGRRSVETQTEPGITHRMRKSSAFSVESEELHTAATSAFAAASAAAAAAAATAGGAGTTHGGTESRGAPGSPRHTRSPHMTRRRSELIEKLMGGGGGQNMLNNSVLSALPVSARTLLLKYAEEGVHPAGSILMREGDPSDCMHFITGGTVSIIKSGVEIARQENGGVLGEMGLLTSQPRTATVRCVTEVRTLCISSSHFLRVTDCHPMMYRALLREMVEKIQCTQQVRVKQNRVIQDALDILTKTVSDEVLNILVDDLSPIELLRGRTDLAAILFFDIRGFSSAAERMQPQELLQALNEHLHLITQQVQLSCGAIVNFIGDAVLAVFNTPVPLDMPADAALECYKNCRYELAMAAETRKKEGKVCFEMGGGLNFGLVVAGAIGSENRFSYSVLGDEVNVAARLEGLTRHYPVDVILSEALYDHLSEEGKRECLFLDYIRVKGRATPVRIYTVLLPREGLRRCTSARSLNINRLVSSASRRLSEPNSPRISRRSSLLAIPNVLPSLMRRTSKSNDPSPGANAADSSVDVDFRDKEHITGTVSLRDFEAVDPIIYADGLPKGAPVANAAAVAAAATTAAEAPTTLLSTTTTAPVASPSSTRRNPITAIAPSEKEEEDLSDVQEMKTLRAEGELREEHHQVDCAATALSEPDSASCVELDVAGAAADLFGKVKASSFAEATLELNATTTHRDPDGLISPHADGAESEENGAKKESRDSGNGPSHVASNTCSTSTSLLDVLGNAGSSVPKSSTSPTLFGSEPSSPTMRRATTSLAQPAFANGSAVTNGFLSAHEPLAEVSPAESPFQPYPHPPYLAGNAINIDIIDSPAVHRRSRSSVHVFESPMSAAAANPTSLSEATRNALYSLPVPATASTISLASPHAADLLTTGGTAATPNMSGLCTPATQVTTRSEDLKVKLFERARDTYLQGNFAEAEHLFRQVGGALGKFFMERCRECAQSSTAWPGYYTWDVK